MGRKKPKKPKASAEEKARERLQARQLDKEIAEGEKRFKALARNKLGAKSLLADKVDNEGKVSGAPKSSYENAPKKGLEGLLNEKFQGVARVRKKAEPRK